MQIGIMGTGAIGGYLGGCLAAAGAKPILVGRPNFVRSAESEGIKVTDVDGRETTVRPSEFKATADLGELKACDAVLLTVKSGDTAAVAEGLKAHLAPKTLLFSLQNGVRNVETLRSVLPGQRVISGMVPYNVARGGETAFHRAMAGALVIEKTGTSIEGPLLSLFGQAGLQFEHRHDVLPIQWGKLLLNLNNALNAISGLTLKDELGQRGYRVILAALIAESLQVFKRAEIKAKLQTVPPHVLPAVLRLPDPVFRVLAKTMLAMDDRARSSMWDDFQRGRKSEVEFINGEIVRVAKRTGMEAPLNGALVAIVREVENEHRSHAPERLAMTARDIAAAIGLRGLKSR